MKRIQLSELESLSAGLMCVVALTLFAAVWARDDLVDALIVGAVFAAGVPALLAPGKERASTDQRAVLWAGVVAVPAMVFVLIAQGIDETADRSFFEAAAQIIPILGIALAIEARESFMRASTGNRAARAMGLTTFALLVYGEYEALAALAGGPRNLGMDAEMVGAALAAGAAGIVIIAILGQSSRE